MLKYAKKSDGYKVPSEAARKIQQWIRKIRSSRYKIFVTGKEKQQNNSVDISTEALLALADASLSQSRQWRKSITMHNHQTPPTPLKLSEKDFNPSNIAKESLLEELTNTDLENAIENNIRNTSFAVSSALQHIRSSSTYANLSKQWVMEIGRSWKVWESENKFLGLEFVAFGFRA